MEHLDRSSKPEHAQLGRCDAVGDARLVRAKICSHYKPTIWGYDAIQSLGAESNWEDRQAPGRQELREAVKQVLRMKGPRELEVVDWIQRLGLAELFEEEIKDVIHAASRITSHQMGLRAVALRFRLLRQHGYFVSQDVFTGFLDGVGADIRGMVELLEASHLGLEGEVVMEEARCVATAYLKGVEPSRRPQEVGRALELPLQQRVPWFGVRSSIDAYEKQQNCNPCLLRLAKLNFNMVQAAHQTDLKDVSTWWKELGLIEAMPFTRDRLVESFLWAVGVSSKPASACLRKCLTKAITLVLVIDDVYDMYGSVDELQRFTHAIDTWDAGKVEHLPECMKVCFEALRGTVVEVCGEIQKETGGRGRSALPCLKKAWADFCRALFVEAKWCSSKYTPSLEQYLQNGSISSCGPLLCTHAILFGAVEDDGGPDEDAAARILEKNHDLIHLSSRMIRLFNDIGTSPAEQERGDAPSCLQCSMAEGGGTEEEAARHMNGMIGRCWKKMNGYRCRGEHSSTVEVATNIARVAGCIYQHGDGFGNQDGDTRQRVLSLLIHPLPLDSPASK